MVFDYASLANTALVQINDKGRTVSIVYKTEGSYNPALDNVLGNSENSVDVKALVTSFNSRFVDGTVIKAGDLLMTIAASGIDKPKTNDKVVSVFDGEFTIVSVAEVKPGETALLYKLQVRK